MNEAKYLIIDTTYMLKNKIFFYSFKYIKKNQINKKKKELLKHTYTYKEAIKKMKKIKSFYFKKEKEKIHLKLLKIK